MLDRHFRPIGPSRAVLPVPSLEGEPAALDDTPGGSDDWTRDLRSEPVGRGVEVEAGNRYSRMVRRSSSVSRRWVACRAADGSLPGS